MSEAAYLSEPFIVSCVGCGVTEVRDDREGALAFRDAHAHHITVLSPWRNRAEVPASG